MHWQEEFIAGKQEHDHREEFEQKLLGIAFPPEPYEAPKRTDGGGVYRPATVEYQAENGEEEVFDNPIPGIPNVKPLDL